MKNLQRGDVFGWVLFLIVVAMVFAALFVRFNVSNERVSGIVYNTKNDALLSGKTTFSVRAGENTPIYRDENGNTNESSYCLPKGSPYIEVVNRAAENKEVKVVVTTTRYFAIQAPWACNSNVKVTEVK